MDEDKDKEEKAPEQGQAEENAPSAPEGGQAEEKDQEAPEKPIPDKLKGKSSDELIKMYGELSSKLGAQGVELGQARQLTRQMQVVLQAIEGSPQAKTLIEAELVKISGKAPEGDKKPDGEVKTDASVKRAVEGQIIREFEEKQGLTTLNPDERQVIYARIGTELTEMLDPGGTKSQAEVLDSIDLTKLPQMLERALFLANRDGEIEKATKAGMVRAQQNRGGMIGSIPSSGSVSSPGQALTAEEREVARSLSMSDEEYQKYKNTPQGEDIQEKK